MEVHQPGYRPTTGPRHCRRPFFSLAAGVSTAECSFASAPMSQSTLAPRRSLFALSALAIAASAHAQNKLDTVVTTAARTPQRLSEVLADLTVITRADIERQAAASVADLLRNNGCA